MKHTYSPEGRSKGQIVTRLALAGTFALAGCSSPEDNGSGLDLLKHEATVMQSPDERACDHKPGSPAEFVIIQALTSGEADIAAYKADSPKLWDWTVASIRHDLTRDPFIEDFTVRVDVRYDNPDEAMQARLDALHYEDMASLYLDLPKGNPQPNHTIAMTELGEVDSVSIQAIRPAICPA
jgi:hypothetical protein